MATVGKWRMPTKDEFSAPNTACKGQYDFDYNITITGDMIENGKVKKGRYYLAANQTVLNGYYWSSTYKSSDDAYQLKFYKSGFYVTYSSRWIGYSIRPVAEVPLQSGISYNPDLFPDFMRT